MSVMVKRLVSLNMALLLLILSIQPALAVGTFTDWQEREPMADSGQADFDGIERLAEKEFGADDASLFSDTEAAYEISVDGEAFLSDTDAYGNGWEYTAEDNTLWLENYSGGAIRSDGDLDIYSFGTVTVTGSSGTTGSSGIFVNGLLTLYVPRGSLTVRGGNGTTKAGDAVTSAACICLCYPPATASFTGGATTGTDASASTFGGDGIYGLYLVELIGSGITVVGGNGAKKYGGSGVYSAKVYVHNPVDIMDTEYASVDCLIHGGNGATYGGPGIFYSSKCEFGEANIDVVGGSNASGDYYIPYLYDNAASSPTLSVHTTQKAYTNAYCIRVKQYTLLLRGNGGYRNGASSTSLTGYYPSTYCLTDYQFQQNNYTQVGWSVRATGGSLEPLNLWITPTTPTSLYARWVATDSGDILLNGLDGTLDNGERYQKFSGTQISLPYQLTYEDPDEELLGWCTVADATPSDLDIYHGQWYSGGDAVAPDSSAPIVLYAHPQAGGQYAVYHPTQGTVANGGTIIVQGTSSTRSDLTVYTPGSSAVTAPDGYELAGWSETENSQTVDFKAGAFLSLSPGTVQHLYAVWEPAGYTFQPEDGITIISRPSIKTVQVMVTPAWHKAHQATTVVCALYDQGKMTACAMTDCLSGWDAVTELTYPGSVPPVCKVFALGADSRPVFAGVTCGLSSSGESYG